MRNPLRSALERSIHKMTGAGTVDFDQPPGDPGLLGPDSVAWRVHADFVPMIAGGVSALMTQMLHPLAIAGVWDHSNFRADVMGRLARTAQFVAGVTYAAAPVAEKLIERVKRRHAAVVGLDASGRAYSANDPALLTWVHVAEASGFLAAYLRFVDPKLARSEQDRYFRETALIAEKLGARDVPLSAAEAAAYLEAMTPDLRFDDRTREVLAAISTAPVRPAVLGAFRRLVMAAGFELMPAPMRALVPAKDRPRLPGALQAMAWAAPVGGWALRDSAAKKSRRRAAAEA